MFCLPNRLPNELAVLGPDINFIKCSNQCSLDHQAAYLKSRKSLFRISGIWTKPFSPILTNVPVVCMRKGGGEREIAPRREILLRSHETRVHRAIDLALHCRTTFSVARPGRGYGRIWCFYSLILLSRDYDMEVA